jgi:hypothetical protein
MNRLHSFFLYKVGQNVTFTSLFMFLSWLNGTVTSFLMFGNHWSFPFLRSKKAVVYNNRSKRSFRNRNDETNLCPSLSMTNLITFQ